MQNLKLNNMIEIKNGKIDARHLHALLDSKKAFATWIKKKIEATYLKEGIDYFPTWEQNGTRGRPTVNYLLTIEAAKHISIIQQTVKGKELREYLIGLSSKVEQSELHTDDQIIAMVKLKEVFKYVCYQEDVEKLHHVKFVSEHEKSKNPHAEYHIWRNRMLELEPSVLEERIKQYCADNLRNIKAKTKRDKLLIIDKYETVRNAVWDFLELKGELNSMKIANLVKRMAEAEGMQLFRTNETDLFRLQENIESPKLLK